MSWRPFLALVSLELLVPPASYAEPTSYNLKVLKKSNPMCLEMDQFGSQNPFCSPKKGYFIKQGGMIFCLLIALGVAIGCSQQDTPQQSETPPEAPTVNAGYRDFKFGMKGSDLEAFNNRVQVCERIEGPQISEKELKWVGINCYEIAGKRRNMDFRARRDDERIYSIDY
ncbi:MAG: hypothetical protein E8D47_12150 [Nitrospira sp.]|nr:MAG: hypothetical protein E8D47_12150 [Nitrospira sp.]